MGFYIKEIFYSLQGEGVRTGRPAVFCRFAKCNLWSGKEQDRLSAMCQFCDTNFHEPYAGIFAQEEDLVQAILDTFPPHLKTPQKNYRPYVILTGGEPSLQLTQKLIDLLHINHIEIGIETNGTRPIPKGIDWITVSPKGNNPVVITKGNELKLVWPQENCTPKDFTDLLFDNFILQPKHDCNYIENLKSTISFCMENAPWKLGIQMHKIIGMP